MTEWSAVRHAPSSASRGGRRQRRLPRPLAQIRDDAGLAQRPARHEIAPRKTEWQHELATFRVELYCNDKLSQQGSGALVLDSPLLALRYLIELLAKDPYNPPLRAGEIISTGTLTLAMPVSAGERWTTRVSGIPLEEISLQFE